MGETSRKQSPSKQAESALLKRALGYELREEKTIVEEDANGSTKTKREVAVKEVGPDLPSILALLKANEPGKWAGAEAEKRDPVIQVVSGIPRPERPEAEE